MKFRFLVMLLLTSLLLNACSALAPTSPAAPKNAPIALTDGMGRPVSLPAPAQKIISLAPSNTEILFALNAGEQLIGRDEFSDTPAQAKQLPSVGGSMGKYNLEEITRLAPDLVLAAEINAPELIRSLEDLKLTVYVLANPTDLEGVYANLEIIASLTGRQAEARKLTMELKARVNAVEKAAAKTSNAPLVFYELDGTDAGKPWTAGSGTFIDTLIQKAGGRNAASGLQGYPQISLEELLVINPEIILLGDAAYGTTPDQVKARAGWGTLKAVQTGQVYAFDDNLVSRPGPRLVDGLVQLIKLIHPEVSADLK